MLPHVIELLDVDFLEAGRTSVLSTRWKHVWAYIYALSFDSRKIIYDVLSDALSLEVETPKYLNWVDQVISSYKAQNIDEFRVQFDFSEVDNFKEIIDNWLRFAVEKRVKRLEMDFAVFCGPNASQCYTFPKGVSCSSLTSLELGYITVTGEILENFLRNCLALEYLSVKYTESLVELTVAGPLLKLKTLIIKRCNSVRKLEIAAPNLVYFCYEGKKTDMKLKSTPKLAEVSIAGMQASNLSHCFSDLSSCLSQIEALSLTPTIMSFEKIILPPEDLVLPRVRNLDLSVEVYVNDDIYFFGSIMKACPTLLHFKLHVNVHKGNSSKGNSGLRKPKPFLHNHLKTLIIGGFCGKPIAMEIAIFLIETAATLEKVTIDPHKSYFAGTPWAYEETPEKINARICAEKIRPHLKTGTKLEIL